MDGQYGTFGPDTEPGARSSLLLGSAAAIPAGMLFGALAGAGSGCLWIIFWYPFVLFFTIPVYALAGGLLGALVAAIVGAASAASRSVKVGCLAGAGTGLVLGLALLAAVLLAPAKPPPFGPGQPINPAADADKERTLERDYLRWMAEQDQGERGGLIIFFVLPVTLCAITSACGAAWRLGLRRSRSSPATWSSGVTGGASCGHTK